MTKSILLATAVALGVYSISTANPYEDEVVAQLLVMEGMALSEGYEQFGEVAIESMSDSRTETYTLALDGGGDFMIVGACDTDCGDIDFRLYDGNGRLLAEDVSDDDVPVVQVQPLWDGLYYLEIEMFDCESNPCAYGIMTLER